MGQRAVQDEESFTWGTYGNGSAQMRFRGHRIAMAAENMLQARRVLRGTFVVDRLAKDSVA
jgi:hypothetical protein